MLVNDKHVLFQRQGLDGVGDADCPSTCEVRRASAGMGVKRGVIPDYKTLTQSDQTIQPEKVCCLDHCYRRCNLFRGP